MRIVTADNLIPTYDKSHPPCAEVGIGETFVMETHDRCPALASLEAFESSIKTGWLCSVTGPVYIKGTHPHDKIRIDILDITLQDTGVICTIPQSSAFQGKIGTYQAKTVDIRDSMVCFSETLRVPINPHVGRIATAPCVRPVRAVRPLPPAIAISPDPRD